MLASLRPCFILLIASILTACSSTAPNTLGELPRTPQASIEQLLKQAESSKPEQANNLRLSAADMAFKQGNNALTATILEQVDLTTLKPAQQVFAATLSAELALKNKQPKRALNALQHPAFERLAELPIEQQIRSQLAKAQALEATGNTLSAARERVFIAPLLSGQQANDNHQRIWALVSSLPPDTHAEPNSDLAGWLALAQTSKQSATLAQQKSAIDQWVSANAQHPAAVQLPQALIKIRELADQPLNQIALLLPQEGPLANAARALRDGFLAAYYNANDATQIKLYDSSRIGSMDAFYQQAQKDGIQLVIGPLEKPLVTQLNARTELPITTLALNYSDNSQNGPAQLFQFGLSSEDEAREAARRAWADGMRRAVALTPVGDWGNRTLAAFRQEWQHLGGELLGSERIDRPVDLAGQIADLFQLRESEARARRLQNTLGTEVEASPTRRQDVDFIFLAATPQQAQQIKPTLAFQYAGDIPVYATSQLFTGPHALPHYKDLEGIRFSETPWLLNPQDPLRQQISQQSPQADTALGRLYAMGADAYLLSTRLTQLKALPDFNLDGLTGKLSLNSLQRVERSLPWAEFQGGQIQPLPTPLY